MNRRPCRSNPASRRIRRQLFSRLLPFRCFSFFSLQTRSSSSVIHCSFSGFLAFSCVKTQIAGLQQSHLASASQLSTARSHVHISELSLTSMEGQRTDEGFTACSLLWFSMRSVLQALVFITLPGRGLALQGITSG